MNTPVAVGLATLALAASAGAQGLATSYTFVPLNQPGRAFSRAYDVNDAGQVVLEAGAATGSTRPFRWENGAFTDLGTLGGPNATATGINAAGTIAGNSWSSNSVFDQNAYIAPVGQALIPIPRPPAPHAVNNFARDINDADLVIGNSNTGWAWTATGGYRLLPAINGSTTSNAQAVNNQGLIAGSSASASGTRATLWPVAGQPINLGTIEATNPTSVAFGISDRGIVVGYSGDPLAFSRAFVWTESGGMADLGAPGGRSSFANDLTPGGLIVGYASFATNPLQRAYAWYDGAAVDLNTLLPAGSGWELTEAYGVNSSGWIVGRGTLAGQTQAWLLVPNPAPCYANCDGSTAAPALNALDFSCFLQRYQAAQSRAASLQAVAYANCDGSTSVPTLNALDFGCFLNRYVQGCP